MLWALLILAGLVLWVRWRVHQRETQAEAQFPPEGRILMVDGHPVHVVEMGQGPDLVLIHGASGNTRDMTFSLAGQLAQAFRVLVFDRPGLGYTPAMSPRGDSLSEQAALLQKASAAMGAERPLVMGQSYGGAVALAWALNHPDHIAGLTLSAAASCPWDTPLEWLYRINSHPLGRLVAVPLLTAFVSEAYVQRAIADVFPPQAPPQGYAAHIGAPLSLRRASLRANANQRATILAEIKAQAPFYPTIAVPTEIVHGDRDPIVGHHIHSEPLARRIPDARLTLLPGIGHMPHHVAQPEMIDAIYRTAQRAGLR